MVKRIAIIGGGILGMTLALRLSRSGFAVSIFETASKLGGLISPTKIGPYTWDRFYHVILISDTETLGLLEEIGLKNKVRWEATKTGFYTDNMLHSMSNVIEFLKFRPLGLMDKLRLGANIFYAANINSWQPLENVLVADWLGRLSGQRTLEKIWLPLLKAKLGDNYRVTSAAFIWATIRRMYGGRKSTVKSESLGYIDRGYETVVDGFHKVLKAGGVEVYLDNRIDQIRSKTSGIVLRSGQNEIDYDAAILTIPCFQIAELCPQLHAEEMARLKRVKYQGILCAAIINKRPLADYYVTNITDKWVPFTGVIEMTTVVKKKYFDGNSLLYLPRYLTATDAYWQKSDEKVQLEFLRALERMYPDFKQEQVVAFKTIRAKFVHPLNTLRYSEELLPSTITSQPGVFIANSAQIPNGTMNVNEIVGLANRKAKEVEEYLNNQIGNAHEGKKREIRS